MAINFVWEESFRIQRELLGIPNSLQGLCNEIYFLIIQLWLQRHSQNICISKRHVKEIFLQFLELDLLLTRP